MINYTEKYRCQEFEQLKQHTDIVKLFQLFLKSNQLFNLILYGNPGTGKSTIVKIFQKQYKGMSLSINGSLFTKDTDINTQISQFGQQQSEYKKLIIIEEADQLSAKSQNYIHTQSIKDKSICFILVCNNLQKIIQVNNFVVVQFDDIKPDTIKQMIKDIHPELTQDQIDLIIYNSQGDMRKPLYLLQQYEFDGFLIKESDIVNLINGTDENKEILKSGKYSISELLQCIHKSTMNLLRADNGNNAKYLDILHNIPDTYDLLICDVQPELVIDHMLTYL